MTMYNGAEHWVGFKPEAAPGTPEATVNTFLATELANMQPNIEMLERKAHLGTGARLAPTVGGIKPDGKARGEMHASQPHPWYWGLGGVTTTQPAVGTDPTVYLHTILVDAAGPVSLTAEGDLVYGLARQAGVMLNKISLGLQAGELAQMDLSWLGLAHDDGPTITSVPAFTTDPLTTMSMLVKIDGTQDLRIPSLDFDLDNLLEAPSVLQDNPDGGPAFVRRKEVLKATGKMSFVDFPADQLAKLRACTPFALILEMRGAIISNAYRKFLRITLPSCCYMGGLDPDVTNKTITGEADFEAFHSPVAGYQIKVEAQNTISTIDG